MINTHFVSPLLLGVALTFSAAHASPANQTIGMAVTNGSFQVDHARVSGSASLFDGSTVQTASAPSVIRLDSGTRLRMGADSNARIYSERLVMGVGLGQLEFPANYTVEARSLKVSAVGPDAVARILVAPERKVTVAALRGTVRVANSAGLVVANVAAGNSLDFEPQEGPAAAQTRASGCVLAKSGKVILSEQTTNIILELEGTGLDKAIGNRVEITGTTAGQAVHVTGWNLVAKGGCSAIAKKLGATATAGAVAAGAGAAGAAGGAATAAGAATVAGAATAAGVGAGTVAVVGGVAAAATVGGLAATGTLPGTGSEPAASR